MMLGLRTFASGLRRIPGHLQRNSSTIVRPPSKFAPRECPTPLVFVSAKDWDPTSTGMDLLLSALPEKGYTCLDVRLSLPKGPITDSQQLMQHFESNLSREIRLSTMSFPPVIFSKSAGNLISQTYISSWPATGICMISPPSSNAVVPKTLLPTPLPEFNYEPKFPISIMTSTRELARLKAEHRLLQEEFVDVLEVEDVSNAEALNKIEMWLDDLGI